MRIKEIAAQVGATNKDVIAFLNEKGYSVSSHMANITDEMADLVRANMQSSQSVLNKVQEPKTEPVREKVTRQFSPDELIPCKSVTPWKLETVGVDRHTVYHWEYFGDIEYVKYSDLQYFRRKKLITAPKVIIMDDDLCALWSRELQDVYNDFLNIDYPEDFFNLPDAEFENLLRNGKTVLKEAIKITAMNMIRNENFPPLQKIFLIDEVLGTCIKEFF